MTLRTITRIGTIYAIAPSFQVQKLTQCGNDQLNAIAPKAARQRPTPNDHRG